MTVSRKDIENVAVAVPVPQKDRMTAIRSIMQGMDVEPIICERKRSAPNKVLRKSQHKIQSPILIV